MIDAMVVRRPMCFRYGRAESGTLHYKAKPKSSVSRPLTPKRQKVLTVYAICKDHLADTNINSIANTTKETRSNDTNTIYITLVTGFWHITTPTLEQSSAKQQAGGIVIQQTQAITEDIFT